MFATEINSRGDNEKVKNKFAAWCLKKGRFKGFIRKYFIKKEINDLFSKNDIEEIIQTGTEIIDPYVSNIYQQQLISMNNAKYIYLYAKYVEKANVELLENALVELNDLEYIYLFARDVKNSSTMRLEKIIAQSLNINYIIKFANEVEHVNINLFEDMLIGEGCIAKLIEYVNSVTKCNRFRIIQKIINSGTPKEIMDLKKKQDLLGKKPIEDELMMHNDYIVICKFMNYSQRKKELEDYILKSGNAKAIYTYAKDYHPTNIDDCQDNIILTNDMEYIYKFGCDVPGVDTDKLVDAIISINVDETKGTISDKLEILIKCAIKFKNSKRDSIEKVFFDVSIPKYLYLYALKVPGANIAKIEKKLIEIKNARYMCLFALNIEGANISTLEQLIRLCGTVNEIETIKSFYENMIERNIITLDKYEDAMINLNCAKYIYDIMKKYHNVDFDKLEKAILQTKDLEYVFRVARLKTNGDITLEEDVLAASVDLTYLIMFYNLENANKIRIKNVILNCGNAAFVYSFGVKAIDVDTKLVMQALITIGDESYIRKYCNYLGGTYQRVKKNY